MSTDDERLDVFFGGLMDWAGTLANARADAASGE